MEEVDTITVAVSGIDINKVEPLDTRRLVTFINHYLATTVSFLNHFATQCESKLDRMQQQLHRVECRLKLLECKLASIPGIPSTPTVESAATAAGPSTASASSSSQGAPVPGPSSSSNSSASGTSSRNIPNHCTPTPAPKSDLESSSSPNSNNLEKQTNGDDNDEAEDQNDGKTGGTITSAPSNKEDPKYAKYFKMVTVGVPIPAVKQKMMQDGVDPSALDN